jgi:hypothetical protein
MYHQLRRIEKPEGKRPIGRTRRLEVTIRMDLRKISYEGMNDFTLVREGFSVGSCEHGNGLSGYIKGREIFDQLSDYQLLCST